MTSRSDPYLLAPGTGLLVADSVGLLWGAGWALGYLACWLGAPDLPSGTYPRSYFIV